MSSHFDEKSGVVNCVTDWGQWYQTAEEIILEINTHSNIRGRDVSVKITPTHISCFIKKEEVLDGDLTHSIIIDESTWSVEDNKLVRILLTKSLRKEGACWKSLFADGRFAPDEWTFDQMQRKVTLEKYQVDHPGFDFSSATISGNYISGGAQS
ncbi:nudC domain-containing protein 2-like [Clavelina lepadiformis]|uniref:CS domain-containing protein n=1 Tax=Clavelina lepadiformis TaxID=159417 RepID=A0ABP0GFX4_CLALP